jgi:hypothetical protein
MGHISPKTALLKIFLMIEMKFLLGQYAWFYVFFSQ